MANTSNNLSSAGFESEQDASKRLVAAVQELSLARELETVMRIVRRAARDLTGADGATFVLREGDDCFYADEDAINPLWKGRRFPMSACISGWVMTHAEPVVIEDVFADPRIPAEAYRSTFVQSLAMVPIRTAAPVGAIGNYWATRHRASPEQVRLLQALADSTSMAMENIQIYSRLQERVMERTRALQESEARYRALFEQSSDPLLVMDAGSGAVVEVNERACELFGYDREGFVGLAVGDLEVGERASAATSGEASAAARGDSERFHTRLRHGDGKVRDYLVHARRVVTGERPLIQWLCRDITEHKRMRAERRQHAQDLEREVAERRTLNQELESFSYSVSHDLRGPLRAVDGYSGILEEDYAGVLDDTARDYLRRTRTAVARMHELMDGLLLLSRVTRRELEVKEVDLSGLAEEVAAELIESAPERAVEWRIEPGLVARGDPGLLRILLQNLLGNALKFSGGRDPAVIEVGRVSSDEGETLFVRDNGAGFDRRHADSLFQPFHRLHAVEEFSGTGIGLATVERIVKRHGGAVWGRGAVGQGATLYFRLP